MMAKKAPEAKISIERWQKMSTEKLPGLDIVFQETKAIAADQRLSGDNLTTRAALVMGFATVILSVLIDVVDKINIWMILFAAIPYAVLIIYAYSAYRIRDYAFTSPHPKEFFKERRLSKNETFLKSENEAFMKLVVIEYMSTMIDRNSELNDQRAENINKSLAAFFFLIVYLAFIVIDAQVGIVSYLMGFY